MPAPAAVQAKLDALKGKVKGRGRLDLAHMKELRDATRDVPGRHDHIRGFLLEHYQSPEGLAEIAASPHRDRTPEQIVELLMQEFE